MTKAEESTLESASLSCSALGRLKCREQYFLFLQFKETLERNSSGFLGFTECQISQCSRLAELSRKQLGTISVLTETS